MPEPLAATRYVRRRMLASARAFALVACLFIAAGSVSAAPPAAPQATHEQLELQSPNSLRHYGYDEGLPQASVNAIVRAHDGFLWLGTFGGLARFDGREFRVFRSGIGAGEGEWRTGPSSERILSLHEDAHQRLWIGTQEAGVSVYEHGRFRHLSVCGGTCQVNRLFSADGRDIWVMATNGLFRVDTDSLQVTPYANTDDGFSLFAVLADRSFVGGLGGFARISERIIERIPLPDGFRIVRKMSSDEHSVWVSVENGSLYRYDVATGRWSFIRTGLRTESHLFSDGRGHVYLSDETAGIRLVAPDGTEQPVDGAHALHAGTAYADDDGTLWIGSTTKGLWRLRPARVGLLRSTIVGSSPGRVVARDGSGGMWFALGCSGLWHRTADGVATRRLTKPGLSDECIVNLLYDDASEAVWIGTSGGPLARLKNGQLEHMGAWSRSSGVAVWKAENNDYWIATGRVVGRLRLAGDGAIAGVDELPALQDMGVSGIVDARAGGVWIVGDRGAFRVVGNDIVERWTSSEGVRGRYFRTLHEDADGVLWIGTYGNGLVRIQNGVVHQYTEESGLFDDTVSCLLEDRAGRLWMAGNRGIGVLLDRHIGADGPSLLTFAASDGLDPPEFNGGTAFPCAADAAGRLWFAMVSGFATVDSDTLDALMSSRIPQAYIDHAAVSQRSLDLSSPQDLDANAAHLEIGFGAVDLVDPDKVRFRYRIDGGKIDGENGEWIDAGSNRSVLMPLIPWGALTFEVQARELGGAWSPSARLHLNRPIPWYRHQWIWLAASLACLLALLWMTRDRRQPDIDDALLARLRKPAVTDP